MPSTHIVLCHPERSSFTARWADATARACTALGRSVTLTDLYAIGFDPAERGSHYTDPAETDVLKRQEAASKAGALPPDVTAEIANLRAADLLILHFPLWWFAPPAMLKGWCDRVLANGAMHDAHRRFDAGPARGKRVLFCVTTGSSATESAPDGKEGDIALLLWPLAYTFRYLGYDIYRPEVLHGVHGYHRDSRKTALEARLTAALDSRQALIGGLPNRPLLPFNADTDFDETGRLKPGAPSHWPFIRHEA